MKLSLLLLIVFSCVRINAQIVDSTLIDDKSSLLNKYESEILNEYLKEQRDTFNFSQKRILFVTGSSGTVIGNKRDYFADVNEWDEKYSTKIATFLILFSELEKLQSGGYDAIVTYWVKIVPNKEKLIKKISR